MASGRARLASLNGASSAGSMALRLYAGQPSSAAIREKLLQFLIDRIGRAGACPRHTVHGLF